MNTKDVIIKSAIDKIIKLHLPYYELTLRKQKPVVLKKPKGKFTWILIAGHGGVNPKTGVYQSPHKQHIYKDGYTVKEGVLNRKVLAKVLELAKDLPFELQYELPMHEWKQENSKLRTKKVNDICKEKGKDNCRLLAIHHNGHQNPKANGIETLFYRSGERMANILNKHQSKEMKQFRNRGVKFQNLYITRDTNCKAVLVEGGFMTNREDTEEMKSEKGILSFAKSVIAWIKEIEETHA